MGWFQTVDCDCPEPCGADPCTSACVPCTIHAGYQPLSGDETFDVEGMFLIPHSIAIDRIGSCSCYPMGPGPVADESWRIWLYADGYLLFDSGCVTGNMSTEVEIPLNTTRLRFVLADECAFECESSYTSSCSAYFSCV